MPEIWKSVRQYKTLYAVSSRGRVKSLPRQMYRQGKPWGWNPGRFLRQGTNPVTKYKIVALCKNGRTRYFYVHRLVAQAFVPNPRNCPEVNHKDLNKSNNHATNLEWKTSKGNKQHAVRRGVNFNPYPKRGGNSPLAKLTWKKVRILRTMWNTGLYTRIDLAEFFRITPANCCYIISGKTWKDQTGLTAPTVTKKE